MRLNSRIISNVNVVTVKETRIDAAVAIQFKDEMRAITDEGPDRVVLDLSEVGFVDSSGLGAIVAMKKHFGTEKTFELAGLTHDVAKVFQLTRMDMIFTIHDSADPFTAQAAG
ncbi:Putative anti-sigma factor antagonist [Roseovarius albus]|uniref:Putative anti-sigma factor antagonist n=1 Tax=Roseovarius albus TaxID=1247867 RepID=A0A1X6YVN8_9RHOB|nr:STAS domain-containing protein [Roseovarius albus]SLN31989.1 Putative anti-sigma factor antagonist [Roseovarius albus]